MGGRADKGVLGSVCNSTFSGKILGEDLTELKPGDVIASSDLDPSVPSVEEAARAMEWFGDCVNLENEDKRRDC